MVGLVNRSLISRTGFLQECENNIIEVKIDSSGKGILAA